MVSCRGIFVVVACVDCSQAREGVKCARLSCLPASLDFCGSVAPNATTKQGPTVATSLLLTRNTFPAAEMTAERKSNSIVNVGQQQGP